jgi:hypothetical protein
MKFNITKSNLDSLYYLTLLLSNFIHPPPYCHFFYLLTRKLVDKIGSLVSAAVCIFQNKYIDFQVFWRDFDSVFWGDFGIGV